MRNSAGASQLMDGSGRTAKSISYLSGNKERTSHSCLLSWFEDARTHFNDRCDSSKLPRTTERGPLTKL